MNFPMDSPFFQFLFWLVNTPGNGGIVVGFLAGSILLTFASTLKWISDGGEVGPKETYAYPTVGLHDHEE